MYIPRPANQRQVTVRSASAPEVPHLAILPIPAEPDANDQYASLQENIKAYEAQQEELEKHHKGKYVVFHNCERIGIFDTIDAASREAVRRFGRGPYLIRQVGQGMIHVYSSTTPRPGAEHAAS